MRDCQATSGGQAKVVRRRLDAVRHFSALESAGYRLGHFAAPATPQRRPPRSAGHPAASGHPCSVDRIVSSACVLPQWSR